MKKLCVGVAAAAMLAVAGASLTAQQPAANSDVHILPVRGNVWMLTAGGSNIALRSARTA